MVKIHIGDINSGNNLFESRMRQLADRKQYSDEYLLNHVILTPDFISPLVVTFKLQDGNHAFAEYMRRYPETDIIDIPDSCFNCSEKILNKYFEKCL